MQLSLSREWASYLLLSLPSLFPFIFSPSYNITLICLLYFLSLLIKYLTFSSILFISLISQLHYNCLHVIWLQLCFYSSPTGILLPWFANTLFNSFTSICMDSLMLWKSFLSLLNFLSIDYLIFLASDFFFLLPVHLVLIYFLIKQTQAINGIAKLSRFFFISATAVELLSFPIGLWALWLLIVKFLILSFFFFFFWIIEFILFLSSFVNNWNKQIDVSNS